MKKSTTVVMRVQVKHRLFISFGYRNTITATIMDGINNILFVKHLCMSP